MGRLIRMEDSAGAQDAQSSASGHVGHSQRPDEAPGPRPRRRLLSLPLGNEPDLPGHLRDLTLDSKDSTREEVKREGRFLGLIRRASVSLRTRSERRLSHATEDRRNTTWQHKLKQAASFSRPSRGPSTLLGGEGAVDSSEALQPSKSGTGAAPPVIPRGTAGAAARRQAAAQNEFLGRARSVHLLPDETQGDRESGIGIPVTTNEPTSYTDISISRVVGVDFMGVGKLPSELVFHILSHLDHRDLIRASLTSKRWAYMSQDQQVWRQSFLREKSKTYAMSMPILPGKGHGIPNIHPDKDWKDIYRIRVQLERNWRDGKAAPVYLSGHLDSIYCVQFDESKIITGSRDKTIRVWDMRSYSCKLIIGPPDVIRAPGIMTAEDGSPQHYAMCVDQVRRAESTPQRLTFPIHHNQSILCLQYDDNILVTGSSDGSCIVYDIKNNYEPTMRLKHHTAAVLDLAFDDRYIVTCSKDISICVWDRETGAMLKQLRGHSGPVNAVQMRGNTIVSCSGDFRVKLWNIDTGKNIREFLGHTKGLACSQFSDDSKYIASAGNDKIIRIWDANTGECLQRIAAHDNLVRSLHIDPVSGRLVSGSYDQDIKVFDMESGRLLLDFPKWHQSWVLGAKSDYRRIISTGQDPKILIMDFGLNVDGIEELESD